MIQLIFFQGNDIVLIQIRGNHITFCNSVFGAQEAPIDGLKLSYDGALKEYPDLKDRPDWKEEVIKRFKTKIKEMRSEDEIANYIIEDLRKYGFEPKHKLKQGFRRESIK